MKEESNRVEEKRDWFTRFMITAVFSLLFLATIIILSPGVVSDEHLCTSNAVCPGNHDCVDGSCLLICTEHANCPPGYYCDGAYCIQTDETCSNQEACRDGWYCSPVARICAPGNPCNRACADEETFYGTGCTDALPECYNTPECLKGECLLPTCVTDTDCFDICHGGYCVTGDNDNDNYYASHVGRTPLDCNDYAKYCSEASDCASDVDNDGVPDCQDICVDGDIDGSCNMFGRRFHPFSDYGQLSTADREKFDMLGFEYSLPSTDAYFLNQGYTSTISRILSSDLDTVRKIFGDCNDDLGEITPFVEELDSCDRVDNDCDGIIDECPADKECIYSISPPSCKTLDFDGDGYNNKAFGCSNCNDCDDGDVNINPGIPDCVNGANCLPEVCAEFDGPCNVTTANGGDDNCNGIADDGADTDEDGTPDSLEDPGCQFEGPINGDRSTINPATGCLYKPGGWT